jgi:hypothetical protein
MYGGKINIANGSKLGYYWSMNTRTRKQSQVFEDLREDDRVMGALDQLLKRLAADDLCEADVEEFLKKVSSRAVFLAEQPLEDEPLYLEDVV